MSDMQPTKKIVLGYQKEAAAAQPAREPEIHLLPFPEARVYRWAPAFAAQADSSDIAIVVSQEVLLGVNEHVRESLDREIGGFLLGNRYRCPNSGRDYVVIDQFSPAVFAEGTSVSLSFNKDAWAKLADELHGKFRGKLLVGWYHSHPRMNVFLSEFDVAIHEQRFSDSFMSALVIEPEKDLGGFFCRRKGRLDDRVPVEFYEYLETNAVETRESVMPWHRYVCHDGVTEEVREPPRAASLKIQLKRTLERPASVDSQPATLEARIAPFPTERMFHWIPSTAVGIPCPAIATVISQEALLAVGKCVGASLQREIGGFLLGNRYHCPNSGREYVIVDQFSPAKYTESSNASLSFTPEAWATISDELTGKFFGKLLVGWYHSHPKMDIFLSDWDVKLHDARFPEPWNSALVIDPVKNTGGFFARRDGLLHPRCPVDFYEYRGALESPARSVVRWTGYACHDATTNQEIRPPSATRKAAIQPRKWKISELVLKNPLPEEWKMVAVATVAVLVVGILIGQGYLWWKDSQSDDLYTPPVLVPSTSQPPPPKEQESKISSDKTIETSETRRRGPDKVGGTPVPGEEQKQFPHGSKKKEDPQVTKNGNPKASPKVPPGVGSTVKAADLDNLPLTKPGNGVQSGRNDTESHNPTNTANTSMRPSRRMPATPADLNKLADEIGKYQKEHNPSDTWKEFRTRVLDARSNLRQFPIKNSKSGKKIDTSKDMNLDLIIRALDSEKGSPKLVRDLVSYLHTLAKESAEK
jgi:proteasome lid subunit RPN8/RPN11